MALEKQTSWSVLVALDMFLGGTGTGIFTAGFILVFTSDLKWLAVTGMALGPTLVLSGLILALLHSGSPLRAYRLLGGLSTSWMSRGGLIQVLYVISGLGYVLPGFWLSGWLNSVAGLALGSVTLVLALATATYYGILLTEARAIPLWSSSVLPLLSLFIALSSGLGLLLLISPAYVSLYGRTEVGKAISLLGIVGIAFIVGELLSLWTLMGVRSSSIYVESIRKLRLPIVANVFCLLFALILLGMGSGGAIDFIWSSPISGALLLAGGFITRHSILKAGYYVPLRVPHFTPC